MENYFAKHIKIKIVGSIFKNVDYFVILRQQFENIHIIYVLVNKPIFHNRSIIYSNHLMVYFNGLFLINLKFTLISLNLNNTGLEFIKSDCCLPYAFTAINFQVPPFDLFHLDFNGQNFVFLVITIHTHK